ncbi:MAG: hypothetical protein H6772_02945 [Pseudomonadales bacterium]|nr:hypothetical protein [Pseudomonadales bacterium]
MYINKTKKIKMIAQFLIFLVILIFVIISAFQIDVVREFFGQASGENSDIHVYTNAVLGVYHRPWRNLAQGGEDKNWRLEPIVPQIRALNPEYIRIDHIYDFYDVVQGTSGNLSFNFSKLDLIISDILSTGAKPYIALSYMPSQLANGDIIGQPENYADWQLVVQRTIEHISGTRGIADVYYEVWNEPDLFGSWKYYGNKNYLNLYLYASRGAQNARNVQAFKLGGPATTAFYKNWIEALAKFVINNNLKLDFISWHQYSTNIDQYRIDMIDVRKSMEKFPQLEPTVEFNLTEWGHDSDNNAGYDNNFSAAHTVAGSIEMVGIIQKAFSFEIQDGKNGDNKEYWGRWGLFTHQDFGSNPKPRYFALKMLDRIPNQRVQLLGKGSWVKALAGKNLNDNIEIVLANYDSHNSHVENVPITYEDITPGTFKIVKELNNGQNYIENISTTEAKLKTTLFMPANTVGYVTLQRISE